VIRNDRDLRRKGRVRRGLSQLLSDEPILHKPVLTGNIRSKNGRNHQVPNPKLQGMFKFAKTKERLQVSLPLVLEIWYFLGAWCLGFGAFALRAYHHCFFCSALISFFNSAPTR
jgi:hypothetical protein